MCVMSVSVLTGAAYAANLTITANPQTKTYGQIMTFTGAEISTTGLTPGDTVTVTLASDGAVAAAPVGTYNIVPSAAIVTNGSGTNTVYTYTYVNGTMTVNPTALKATLPEYRKDILLPESQKATAWTNVIPNALADYFTYQPLTTADANKLGFPAGVCANVAKGDPAVIPGTSTTTEDCYVITVKKFKQQLALPSIFGGGSGLVDAAGTAFGATTWVYGYGSGGANWTPPYVDVTKGVSPTVTVTGSAPSFFANNQFDVNNTGIWNFPAPTIKGTQGRPVRVQWLNDLPNEIPAGFDPTVCDGFPNDCFPYNRIVTHVHGAHVGPESDGLAHAWFGPGFVDKGPMWGSTRQFGPEGTYYYPMDQEAATIWYHDHATGATHLNTNMGMAGFFPITDANEKLLQGIPNPATKVLPTGAQELGFALQDRVFYSDGQVAMPDAPILDANFPNIANCTYTTDPVSGDIIPTVPGNCSPLFMKDPADGHLVPYPAVPGNPAPQAYLATSATLEFFGNMPVVNGVTYGTYKVDKGVYRMRFIGGTDSRAFALRLKVDGTGTHPVNNPARYIPFWQIGTEQGLLNNPVKREHMVIMPGERVDVLVDFKTAEALDDSGASVGALDLANKRIIVENWAGDAPYGGEVILPVSDPGAMAFRSADIPAIMTFDVSATAVAGDVPSPVSTLSLRPGNAVPTLTANAPTRTVSLVEIVDNYGRIMPTVDGRGFMGHAVTELPLLGSTEQWDIVNTTVDAHPMHLHQVAFQLINREAIQVTGTDPVTGDPILNITSYPTTAPPYAPISYIGSGTIEPVPAHEAGWKDTIMCPPGKVTRVIAKYDIPGVYVWHCHILSHEEHDMMRPLIVTTPAASVTLTASGTTQPSGGPMTPVTLEAQAYTGIAAYPIGSGFEYDFVVTKNGVQIPEQPTRGMSVFLSSNNDTFNVERMATWVPPTVPGTYTITASTRAMGTTGTGNPVKTASVDYTVANASITLTPADLNATFDGTAKPVTFTTTPAALPVNVTYNGSITPPTAAGSYTVVATINDPAAVNFGMSTATLVIAKAPVVITANPQTKTYGQVMTFTGAEIGTTGLAAGDALTVTLASDGAVAAAPVGTYAINASAALLSVGSANNYTFTYVNGTMTINPTAPVATLPEYRKDILLPESQKATAWTNIIPNALADYFTYTPYTTADAVKLGFPSTCGNVAKGDVGSTEDCYTISVKKFQQQLALPSIFGGGSGLVDAAGAAFGATTWVYGYGSGGLNWTPPYVDTTKGVSPTVTVTGNAPAPFATLPANGGITDAGIWHFPAPTIKGTQGRPVRVQWLNDLPNEKPAGLDPTVCDGYPNDCFPYNRIVTHVHGAHVGPESDGLAHAWYGPGFADKGPMWDSTRQFGPEGTYYYPMDQEAATIWYHDHATGVTHLNTNMGMAGFFPITDANEKLLQGIPNPATKVLPTGAQELGFALQDRIFYNDGQVAMPDAPILDANFPGIAGCTYTTDPVSGDIIPTVPANCSPLFMKDPIDGHLVPYPAVPGNPAPQAYLATSATLEFFGNMPVVNGVTYGTYKVDKGVYRMRFIGGTDSRAFALRLKVDGTGTHPVNNPARYIPFWQIGTEQGLLNNPVKREHMVIMPGERVDVLVDFKTAEALDDSGVSVGVLDLANKRIIVENWAGDAPYGGEVILPVSDPGAMAFRSADIPAIMTFDVSALAVVGDVPSPVSTLPLRPGIAIPSLVADSPTRTVSLVEIVDNYGRIMPTVDGRGFMNFPVTELPLLGKTEQWDIVNTTVDAHPMHLHQVAFQLINREAIQVTGTDPVTGDPILNITQYPSTVPPFTPISYVGTGVLEPVPAHEAGWKDTIMCPPGKVTRVIAKYDIPGVYVWHCHILSHEEHDMMRPLIVTTPAASVTLTASGTTQPSGGPMTPVTLEAQAYTGIAAYPIGSGFEYDFVVTQNGVAIANQPTRAMSSFLSSNNDTFNVERKATWIPPTVPGTYTITASTRAMGTLGAGNPVQTSVLSYTVTAPAVTSVATTTVAGTYAVGSVIPITVNFNQPVSTTGLTLVLNNGATISSGALTNVTSFTGSYTVAAGQNTPAGQSLNIAAITGSITDAAGNLVAAPVIPAASNLAAALVTTVDPAASTIKLTSPALVNTAATTITGSATAPALAAVQTVSVVVNNGAPIAATVTAGGSFSAPVTLAAGVNTLSITATDNALTPTVSTIVSTITLDTLATAINVTTPALVNAVATTITGTATAPALASVTSVTVAVNNGNPVAAVVGANGAFSAPVTLVAGNNVITVTATDSTAKVSTQDTSITLDTTASLVVATTPEVVNTATTTITGTITPPGVTAITSVTVSVNNGAPVVATVGLGGSYVYSAQVTLATGTNGITVVATDSTNKVTTSVSSIVLDPTATVIAVTTPPVVNTAATTITGLVTPPALGTVTSIAVTVNGAPVAATVGTAGGVFATTLPVTLAAGNNVITVTTIDNALKQNTVTQNVTFDPAATMIAVTNPVIVNTAATTITGIVTPPALGTITSIAVSVNGTPVAATVGTAGGAFATTLPVTLAAGKNIITITTIDNALKQSTVVQSITFDPAATMIAVTTPSLVNTATTSITGTATPPPLGTVQTVTVTLNGTPVTTTVGAGGVFTTTVPVTLANGNNVLTITAVDAASKQSVVVQNITFDPTATMIAVTTPPLVNTTATTITGTATPPAQGTVQTVTVTVNGTPVTTTVGAGGVFTTTVPATLVTGNNVLTITATDATSKQSTVVRNITFDPTATMIAVTTPPVTTPATTTVTGTVTPGTNGIGSVTVNGTPVTVDPAGNFSQPVTLNPGSNVIVVIVTDTTGKQTRQEYTATVDATLPAVNVTSPTAAVVNTAAITVRCTATDPVGIKSVSVNGTSAAQGSNGSYSADLVLNNGSNNITVVAADQAGNQTMVIRTITLDAVAPLTGTSPAPGTYTGPLSVVLSSKPGSTIHYSVTSDVANALTPLTGTAVDSASFVLHAAVTTSFTVQYYAIDLAGNTETLKTATYVIHVADLTNATVAINNGDQFTNNPVVALTFTATDTIGIPQMQVACDGVTFAAAEAYPPVAPRSCTLAGTDGTKIVAVKYIDSLGTVYPPVSSQIILDTAAPSSSATPVGGTYNGAINVVLASEANAKIYYTTNGLDPAIDPAQLYNGQITIPNTATLKYFAVDQANNKEQVQSQTYTIAGADLSGSVSINGNSPFTNTTGVTLNLAASDPFGVGQYLISDDGTNYQTYDITPSTTSFAAAVPWTLPAGDGVKTVYVKYVDALVPNHVYGPFTAQITLDTRAPATSATPGSGAYNGGVTVVLASEPNAKIYYSTNSVPTAVPANLYTGPITLTTTSTLRYFAVDQAANQEAVKSGTYTIANPDLSGSVAINNNASFTTSNDVTLTLTAQDPLGVGAYMLSNDDITYQTVVISPSVTSFSASIPWTLAPGNGSRTVYVKYVDTPTPNNVYGPFAATITVDNAAPTLSVSTPQANALVNTSTVTVSGTVSDAGGVASVTVNNAAVTIAPNGSFSTSLALSSGVNSFTVKATDLAGNVTTIVRFVTLDTVAPNLDDTSYFKDALVSNPSLSISGVATDAGGIRSVTVNGVSVAVAADGNFDAVVQLVSGANTITFVATDMAGNVTTVVRTVTLDMTAPSLVVTVPANGSIVNTSSIAIIGTVADAGGVTSVSVNGVAVPVAAGGSFSKAYNLLTGTNTITIIATDLAGNTTTVVRTVIFDAVVPATSVTPASGTYSGPLTVALSTEPGSTIHYTVTSDVANSLTPLTATAVDNASFVLHAVATTTFTVQYYATDAAGNTEAVKSATYTIHVADLTNATVAINNGAQFTNNPVVTLSFTATDPVGVSQMQVACDGVTFAAAEAYPPVVPRTCTLAGADGTKTVAVKYIDSLGTVYPPVNSQIVLDTAVPASAATPAGGTYNGAINVVLSSEAHAKIYYTTNGLDPVINPAQLYNGQITIPESATVKYVAVDQAGNKGVVQSQIYTIAGADLNGSVSINGNSPFTNSTGVTLNLAASDPFGVGQYLISDDGTNYQRYTVTPSTTSFAASVPWTLSAGDGVKTIYVKYIDTPVPNNEYGPFTAQITLDTVAPATSATPGSGTYNGGVAVVLASEPNAKIYYSTNGVVPEAIPARLYSGPITLTATSTLLYFAVDQAGNQETVKSHTYTIANPDLSGSIAINNNASFTTSNDVVVTLTAHDPQGIATYMLSNDDITYQTVAISPSVTSFNASVPWKLAPGNGLRTVYVKYVDTPTPNNVYGPFAATITVDNTAPTLSVSTPQADAAVNTSSVTISGTVTDAGGIASVTVNDAAVAIAPNGSFSTQFALSTGANSFIVKATDLAGNVTTITRTVTLDTVVPVTTVAPAAGNYSGAVTVTLTSKPGSTIYYTFDGQNPTTSSSVYSGSFTLSPSATTTYDVRFFAQDRAGNSEAVKSVIYTIHVTDLTNASVAINGGTAFTNSRNVTLALSASDPNGVPQMQVACDGTTFGPVEAFVASRACTLPAGDGVKTVAVKYIDGIGTVYDPVVAEITLDAVKPVVAITTPATGLIVNSASIVVSGTASDANGIQSLTVNGSAVTPGATGAFSSLIGLVSGANTITVTAVDFAGNTTSVVRTATLDSTAPVTTVSPAAGSYSGTVAVTLASKPGATIFYTTNGHTPTTSSAVYSGAIILTAAATTTYNVQFFARDAAGNIEPVKSSIYTIHVTDLTNATVKINNGATVTNSNTVTLALTASDPNGVPKMQVACDGVNFGAEEAFAVTRTCGLTSGDGVKTVAVRYIDGTGTVYDPVSANITVDTVVPVTSATPGAGIYGGSVSVALSASKPATIYYTTNGSEPTRSSAQFTAPILLNATATGDVTIKFFAVDQAGNVESTRTLAYTIHTSDLTQAVVSINSGAQFTGSRTVTLSLAASDPHGVPQMQVSCDGTTFSASEPFAASRTCVLPDGDGLKTVEVRYIDGLGTIYPPIPAQITLDTVAPVTTVSPIAGTYSGTLSVALSANESARIYYSLDGTEPVENLANLYTGPVDLAPSATTQYPVKYFAVDRAGNREATKSVSYTVHISDMVGSIRIDNDAPYTSNTSVVLSLSAVDPAGVQQMQFSNDGINFTAPEDYATSKSWALTPGDGIKTVYVRFMDGTGSEYTYSATITLASIAAVPPNGDINGDGVVDIRDALKAMQISIGLTTASMSEMVRGDVAPFVQGVPAPDGVIDIVDVLFILRRCISLAAW